MRSEASSSPENYQVQTASVIGVVVSSLSLHCGDPSSIPRFSIQAVWIHA